MFYKFKFMSVFSLITVIALVSISGVQASTISREPSDALRLQDGLVQRRVVSQREQKAAMAFWTREQIAAAQALELPVDFGAAQVDESAVADALAFPELAGPPAFTPAGAAAPGAHREAKIAYAMDWAALEETAREAGDASEQTGTSQVYTSYVANKAAALWKIYPHIWVGRLSFSTPNGTSYCSGTSISGNVMLTAAHCLYDSTNNIWYSNLAFTPAYRNGSAPYGTFTATNCWVLTSWVNLSGSYNINTWARHDVGVCKMGKNSIGQTLNNAVGWMGRQWNQPYVRHFHDIGYPFKDFNIVTITDAGKWQRLCAAESFPQTTEVRGMGCNWGPGISGGPWMVAYAPAQVSGYADGVNSGLFVGAANLYAGRFNSSNIVPLCTAAAC